MDKMSTGSLGKKVKLGSFGTIKSFGSNGILCVNAVKDDNIKPLLVDWELELLGKSPPLVLEPLKKKKLEKSILLAGTDSMDWCVRARKVALKLMEDKGMTRGLESMVSRKVKQKKKIKKKAVDNNTCKKKSKVEFDDDAIDSDSDVDDLEVNDRSCVDYREHLRQAVPMLEGGT